MRSMDGIAHLGIVCGRGNALGGAFEHAGPVQRLSIPQLNNDIGENDGHGMRFGVTRHLELVKERGAVDGGKFVTVTF